MASIGVEHFAKSPENRAFRLRRGECGAVDARIIKPGRLGPCKNRIGLADAVSTDQGGHYGNGEIRQMSAWISALSPPCDALQQHGLSDGLCLPIPAMMVSIVAAPVLSSLFDPGASHTDLIVVAINITIEPLEADRGRDMAKPHL